MSVEGHRFGFPKGLSSTSGSGSRRPSFGIVSNTYLLAAADESEVRSLFALLRTREPNPVFELALRRFSGSYGRTTDEDRLIDYWVALEALFLPDANSELSYRIALRVARFIGEGKDERVQLFAGTRASYGARSKIVHGEQVEALADVSNATQETLRRALKLWLDPKRDHRVETIDSELLA